MLTDLLLGALVWGSSECPSPAQIDATLSREVGRRLVVEVTRRPDGVQLEARDTSGQPLAFRVLPAHGDCAALASDAAVVISAWSEDGLQPLQTPRSATLRTPLVGVAQEHAPAPAPSPMPPREWALSAGVVGSPPKSFTGAAELSMAWPGGALALAALNVTAPVSVDYLAHQTQRPSAQVGLSAGFGARALLGGFALDLFLAAPLSLLVPLDGEPVAPLSPGLRPQVLLSALAGARLTARELRFAPFVRAAVELPLVSLPERVIAPIAVSLSLGIAWGGT